MAAYYNLLNRTSTENGIQIAHYRPSIHTQGAWNEHEQHMAPATGVIARELELFQPRKNMQYGRISLDIYGMIYRDDFSITTQCIRPGKTIELIEAKFEVKGRVCIIARAWRMLTSDTTEVSGLEDQAMPHFESLPIWDGMSVWPGGYIKSISAFLKISSHRPGKSQIWLSNDLEMIEGENTSSFVKLMGMVDTMNGTAVRQKGAFTHSFPNLDLQIHLYRMPQGKYLGIDSQQQYGINGIGLTSAVLHDEKGPFGRAEQILTIRKL